jgi:DNA-binding MarR family transcriptional regulator
MDGRMAKNNDILDDHLGKWVAMAHLSIMNLVDEELAKYGLSRATSGFLVHLYVEDGQRQEQVCREIVVNKSTTARAMKKLEDLGDVHRRPEETDRRVVRVFLTPKGRTIGKKVLAVLEKYSDLMASGFSEQQKSDLIAALRKVYNNVLGYKNERQNKTGKITE